MDTASEGDAALTKRIDGELRLLQEANLLVASGRVPRAVVAGLKLAPAVLEPATCTASEAGVRVVPLWTTDEQVFDVRVERLDP